MILVSLPLPWGEGCDFDFSPSPLGRGGTARRGVRGFFAGDAFMAMEVSGARDFDGILWPIQYSHGKCISVRGLFSGAISQRQSYVINLNGAGRYRCLVQSEIVVTGPPPIFLSLHQSLSLLDSDACTPGVRRIPSRATQSDPHMGVATQVTRCLTGRVVGAVREPPSRKRAPSVSRALREAPLQTQSATDAAAKAVRASGPASKHSRRVEIPTAAAKPPTRLEANRIQVR